MTQEQKTTIGDLVRSMTQTEIELTQCQEQLNRAMRIRDAAKLKYHDFSTLSSRPTFRQSNGHTCGSRRRTTPRHWNC